MLEKSIPTFLKLFRSASKWFSKFSSFSSRISSFSRGFKPFQAPDPYPDPPDPEAPWQDRLFRHREAVGLLWEIRRLRDQSVRSLLSAKSEDVERIRGEARVYEKTLSRYENYYKQANGKEE